jgi:hypothetical protein
MTTVLIITHSSDNESVELVTRAVAERGGRAVRLDTDRFPSEVRLAARYGGDGGSVTFADGDEFDLQQRASALLGIPPPIGSTRSTFRSCLLPGMPLNRLSSLGTAPDESNIATAQQLPLAAAAGLWRLAEEVFSLLTRMQSQGLTHGDAHLHNFIVCPSPLEVLPIDFEIGLLRDSVTSEVWSERLPLRSPKPGFPMDEACLRSKPGRCRFLCRAG